MSMVYVFQLIRMKNCTAIETVNVSVTPSNA